jgi:hypothetical protein
MRENGIVTRFKSWEEAVPDSFWLRAGAHGEGSAPGNSGLFLLELGALGPDFLHIAFELGRRLDTSHDLVVAVVYCEYPAAFQHAQNGGPNIFKRHITARRGQCSPGILVDRYIVFKKLQVEFHGVFYLEGNEFST